jgi:hypothetical protein
MFQNLFRLHREFAFDEVLTNEGRIARAFQYRPSLISNIEKLRFTNNSTTKKILPNSTSFSNRAHIEAFQQKKETSQRILPTIESNEIDLTKLVRDTYANDTYE